MFLCFRPVSVYNELEHCTVLPLWAEKLQGLGLCVPERHSVRPVTRYSASVNSSVRRVKRWSVIRAVILQI